MDMFLGNLNMFSFSRVPNNIYYNISGKYFNKDLNWAGMEFMHRNISSVAFGDIDNDGDQDIFLNYGSLFFQDRNALMVNQGNDNNWLKVKLVGSRSNKSAIGSRIRAEITEGGQKRSVYAYVNSGGNYGSNSLQQHIGVGRAVQIDTLEIYWPTTDSTQIFNNVPVNASLRIVEGENQYDVISQPAIKLDPIIK